MSFVGRLLTAALPLIKVRTRLRGLTVGVRAAVFDGEGRVLLVRHSYLPGWHFPGGGVEYGEKPRHALQRELREEAGVVLQAPPRLVGVFHNPEWTAGDHVIFFETSAWTREAWRGGAEIEAAEFFPSADLPADAHESVGRRLAERSGGEVSETW